MDESGIPKREVTPNSAEIHEFLKEEHFRAFYKGVSLIPQHGDGIRFCLAIATVLEDPNTNWSQFVYADLSPEQVEFLGNAMNAQHKTKNIATRTDVLADNRLNALWKSYRAGTVAMLESYIYMSDPNVEAARSQKVIQDFFHNAEKRAAADEFKKILGVIRDSFDKPDVMELLREYRESFKDKDRKTQIPPKTWVFYYRPKFRAMLETYIKQAFGGRLPPNIDLLFITE